MLCFVLVVLALALSARIVLLWWSEATLWADRCRLQAELMYYTKAKDLIIPHCGPICRPCLIERLIMRVLQPVYVWLFSVSLRNSK